MVDIVKKDRYAKKTLGELAQGTAFYFVEPILDAPFTSSDTPFIKVVWSVKAHCLNLETGDIFHMNNSTMVYEVDDIILEFERIAA